MKKKLMLVMGMLIILYTLFYFATGIINNHNDTILNLSQEEKTEDFDYLVEVLEQAYPFWGDINEAGIDKKALLDKYRKEVITSNTDIAFMKSIDDYLSEFKGTGHLSTLNGALYRYYKTVFNLGQSTLDEADKAANQVWFDTFNNPVSTNTYSKLDKTKKGFRSVKGLKKKYLEQNKEAIHITNESSTLTVEKKIIEQDKIAYVKINSFDYRYIEGCKEQLMTFYKDISGFDHLIIDVRDNKGGSDIYWKDLIVAPNISKTLSFERYFLLNKNEYTNKYLHTRVSKINAISTLLSFEKLDKTTIDHISHYVIDECKVEPSNTSSFKGRIWVLVNEENYSAAENFIMFCKNTEFATVVGTATGGDGGMMDPILITLPNSGLLVRFSMLYGLNKDGSGNERIGTTPDIEIPSNSDALSECLSIIREQKW